MAIKLEIKIFIKYLASIHSERSNISNKDFQRTNSEKTGLSLGVKDASLAIEEGEIFVIMGLSGRVNPQWYAFSIA